MEIVARAEKIHGTRRNVARLLNRFINLALSLIEQETFMERFKILKYIPRTVYVYRTGATIIILHGYMP